MALSLAGIQAAASERQDTVEVFVPAWKGNVKLKRLDSVAGMRLGRWFNGLEKREDEQPTDEALVDMYVRVISECAVDDDGQKLFASDEALQLLYGDLNALNVLGPAAMKLNGYDKQTSEELEKN